MEVQPEHVKLRNYSIVFESPVKFTTSKTLRVIKRLLNLPVTKIKSTHRASFKKCQQSNRKTADFEERVLTSAVYAQYNGNMVADFASTTSTPPLPMVDTHQSRSLRYVTGLTSHYDTTASVPCLGLTSDQAPCLKCVK